MYKLFLFVLVTFSVATFCDDIRQEILPDIAEWKTTHRPVPLVK